MSPFDYLGMPIARKGRLVQPMGGWEAPMQAGPLRKPSVHEVLNLCRHLKSSITAARISATYELDQHRVSTLLGRLAGRGMLRVTGSTEPERGRPALIYRVAT